MRLPWALKIGWTVWTILWGIAYASFYGPDNFLWFCNLANFVLTAGLWFESRLLVSWQAVSVLFVQVLFTLDVTYRFVLGTFLFGGTKFMFDTDLPIEIRILSLCMHVGTPPVLIFGLARLGYHRGALPLQIATTAVLLPISFLIAGPERDLNWAWGPFFKQQHLLPPLLYLPAALLGYTLVLYLPSHGFFTRVWPGRGLKESS